MPVSLGRQIAYEKKTRIKQTNKQTKMLKTGVRGHRRLTPIKAFHSREWTTTEVCVRLFCPWSAAGLVEWAVPRLKGAYPKLPVVTPSRQF